MRYRKGFSILALAVSLSLLLTIAMPAPPALAQSITLSPSWGSLGTKVTVTGTSFSSSANAYVYLYFSGYEIKSIAVSEAGTFTTDFNIPGYVSPGVSYRVTALDESGVTLAEGWFIVGAKIDLYSAGSYTNRGKIDGLIQIGGRYFDADKEVSLYFSSDKASIGDNIDREVTGYEYIGTVDTNTDGDFETLISFTVPDKLTDGKDREDVHSGDYYIYATHLPGEKRIKAVAKFIVLDGEIELRPLSGFWTDEVTVTGTGFYSGDIGDIYLYFGGYKLKSIEVSESGTFTADFTVPNYVTPGKAYDISVRDEGGGTLALAEDQFIVGAKIDFYFAGGYTDRGNIDESIQIGGRYFEAGKRVNLYFSSDKASIDDFIGRQVTTYQYIGQARTDSDGNFETLISFEIPSEITDVKDDEEEDVHGGDYYIYALYTTSGSRIKTAAKFIVKGVRLSPGGGTVNSEVEISGEDFGDNRTITVQYDEREVEIAGGENKSDSDGQFTGSIIIPESVAGDHVITVSDGPDNKYEAVFSVKPGITIVPTEAAVGDEVKVNGTGFDAPYYPSDYITITLDGAEGLTKPDLIHTNSRGSFNSSFIVPANPSRSGGSIKVAAHDESFNAAETQLTVLPPPSVPAGMSLSPATSLTSPGHVGMQMTASGTGFTAQATVTVTYSNHETITVATAKADADGNFSATFPVPSSLAGDHAITATDGTNDAAPIFFTMESQAPPVPVPLLSKVATNLETKASFTWEGVTDPSGVTYTFQVASDADFTNIVLGKDGLTRPEYIIIKETGLKPTGEDSPYYWRIKAVDGAFNESGWTPSGLLYIEAGPSRISVPTWDIGIWAFGVFIGIGIIGLIILLSAFRK
ncbi:hypothetical protein ACFLVH_03625 [Chloroflexota bacterium]